MWAQNDICGYPCQTPRQRHKEASELLITSDTAAHASPSSPSGWPGCSWLDILWLHSRSMRVKWAQCFLPQQKLTPLRVTHTVHAFPPIYSASSPISLTPVVAFPSTCHRAPSGGDRRGADRQPMMKYDPVICGLSAAEVVRERESSDVYWEVATDGRRFPPPTLRNLHLYNTQWFRFLIRGEGETHRLSIKVVNNSEWSKTCF